MSKVPKNESTNLKSMELASIRARKQNIVIISILFIFLASVGFVIWGTADTVLKVGK